MEGTGALLAPHQIASPVSITLMRTAVNFPSASTRSCASRGSAAQNERNPWQSFSPFVHSAPSSASRAACFFQSVSRLTEKEFPSAICWNETREIGNGSDRPGRAEQPTALRKTHRERFAFFQRLSAHKPRASQHRLGTRPSPRSIRIERFGGPRWIWDVSFHGLAILLDFRRRHGHRQRSSRVLKRTHDVSRRKVEMRSKPMIGLNADFRAAKKDAPGIYVSSAPAITTRSPPSGAFRLCSRRWPTRWT